MNTITRARQRPRVRSFSYRTLWWLVRRQAMWHIIFRDRDAVASPRTVRWFLGCSTRYLIPYCGRVLRTLPHRRFYL